MTLLASLLILEPAASLLYGVHSQPFEGSEQYHERNEGDAVGMEHYKTVREWGHFRHDGHYHHPAD